MSDFEFHEYANLFPMMTAAEFEELKADIKEKGLVNPIWLYEGKILDGRNRFKACEAVNADMQFQVYTGKDPVGFVVSLNDKRRHLTTGQRAALGNELKKAFASEAKKRQIDAGKKYHRGSEKVVPKLGQPLEENQSDRSEKQAAKIAGVSHGYIAEVAKIEKKAPEIYQKVKDGELSIPQAKKAAGLSVKPPKRPLNEVVADLAEFKAAVDKKHQQRIASDEYKQDQAWFDVDFAIGRALEAVEKNIEVIETLECPDKYKRVFSSLEKINKLLKKQR